MNNIFSKKINQYFVIISLAFVIVPSFFIPISVKSNNLNLVLNDYSNVELSSNNFAWPSPGYKIITSKFGYRIAPTLGASTLHSGIDIAAPPGSTLIAVIDGTITFAGWNGAGGFTITLENSDYKISYCHVDPNFYIYKNMRVKQFDVIGSVGPLNVYSVPNNPYKDKNGNPTNGATTGPHLHFTVRKMNTLINPLELY